MLAATGWGGGLATGEGISVALLVALFVSHLREAIGSASDMREAGTARSRIPPASSRSGASNLA
ncbi:hypothetical protein GCM10009616_24490 [Microlunatus lacustris]